MGIEPRPDTRPEPRVLCIVNAPARASLKLLIGSPDVEVVCADAVPAGRRWARVLVVWSVVERVPADLGDRLATGGELHVVPSLPDLLADVLAWLAFDKGLAV